MTEFNIEIEAESLEEAKEKVKSQIPEGLYLLSEQVISDGKPKTVKVIADTIEAAYAEAQSQVPANAIIVEKKELFAPEHHVITISAFDERSGETEAKRQAGMKLGNTAVVRSLSLKITGKRGIMGIGKTPNQYEADIFQRAVVTITYQEKARIHAQMGDQREDHAIYGDELKELRGLLRRQKGVLYCLQCNSEVQIDLETIESGIRKNRDIATRISGRLVVFQPDISQGTVCKNCKGVVCGKCSREALSRKMEFRNYLEPLIRKHLLRQFAVAAMLNPGVVEESIRKAVPLVLSPADETTILCLKCKQELLMGIDHITD